MDMSPPITPPSPPLPPSNVLQLENCIEELLKFTLISSIQGKYPSALSNTYCANLLKDDPSNPIPNGDEPLIGIPSYPLYKSLATSLYQSICSGASSMKKQLLPLEDLSFKRKLDEWNELIEEKGNALLNMLKDVTFEIQVQEPFFSQLSDGLKTVEGRCAVGYYRRIKSGDIILLNHCVMLEVQDIHQYASFRDMLEAESLSRVLPTVKSIEEGVQVYRRFYSEEKERSNGVLAICVERSISQLYKNLSSILSGLSYGGIQRLLGLVQTVGTVPELLPPPPSSLLSSFLALHKPHASTLNSLEVKGSILTVGARALAKHSERSSKGYWGTLCGNDSEKNRVSEDIIRRLLTHCTWLNMHIVPPHGNVFEIRMEEGYGARWSEDATKFIGFLEPYMADGHSKGWKH